MGKQITSHNQQGGITAEKVTVDGDVTTNVTPPKRSRWKLWTVIGAAAAVVTILSYFGLNWGE